MRTIIAFVLAVVACGAAFGKDAPASRPAAVRPVPRPGIPAIEAYVKANKLDDAMAWKMRRCTPAVGMTEEQLDLMAKAENDFAKMKVATKQVDAEAEGRKTVTYTFFHNGSSPDQYDHSVTIREGKVTAVKNLGHAPQAPGQPALYPDHLIAYFARVGPDPDQEH